MSESADLSDHHRASITQPTRNSGKNGARSPQSLSYKQWYDTDDSQLKKRLKK